VSTGGLSTRLDICARLGFGGAHRPDLSAGHVTGNALAIPPSLLARADEIFE